MIFQTKLHPHLRFGGANNNNNNGSTCDTRFERASLLSEITHEQIPRQTVLKQKSLFSIQRIFFCFLNNFVLFYDSDGGRR